MEFTFNSNGMSGKYAAPPLGTMFPEASGERVGNSPPCIVFSKEVLLYR
ncbi:hypothetical protein SDC9_117373 [bioreactor metagenome]|uniref:Uncharacterized protein n=1 Tax=bioreactor metagenome TaxID=1076179 RepID=A0A645BZ87_9ZZZZ